MDSEQSDLTAEASESLGPLTAGEGDPSAAPRLIARATRRPGDEVGGLGGDDDDDDDDDDVNGDDDDDDDDDGDSGDDDAGHGHDDHGGHDDGGHGPGDGDVVDGDDDGFDSTVDCDDADPEVNPGAMEVCNDGIDDDCDGLVDIMDPDIDLGSVTWFIDADDDGFGDAGVTTLACEQPPGFVDNDGDCRDDDASISPGSPEICGDDIDNDCDGEILACVVDDDGDGFDVTADCDDTNPDVNPDAVEVCNSIDDDCDGLVDVMDSDIDMGSLTIWYVDADGDGFGDSSFMTLACDQPPGFADNDDDCDDAEATTSPGAPEICGDGVDNDCDGIDEICIIDVDGDGFDETVDCDDTNPDVNPGAIEVCNSIDDDCDTFIDVMDPDLDMGSLTIWYLDLDADGFGDSSFMILACDEPPGFADNDDDCDDADATVNPGAIEVCNSIDDDCDLAIDDADADTDPSTMTTWYLDSDGDGWGDPSEPLLACDQPFLYVGNDQDCLDTDVGISPDGVEVCGDGIDSDCDGSDTVCYDGIFEVTPEISAECFADPHGYEIQQFEFDDSGFELLVTGIPFLPVEMSGHLDPTGNDFEVSGEFEDEIFDCDIVYSLSGTFLDNDNWTGEFSVEYEDAGLFGCLLPCGNEEFDVDGTRL